MPSPGRVLDFIDVCFLCAASGPDYSALPWYLRFKSDVGEPDRPGHAVPARQEPKQQCIVFCAGLRPLLPNSGRE